MFLLRRSNILLLLSASGAVQQPYWHGRPKGSRAPVKVNSHHFNLSAPPANANSCQKLSWTEAVHGWVVPDEMGVLECITKCQHVFSWMQQCQEHRGNEHFAAAQKAAVETWGTSTLFFSVCVVTLRLFWGH